MLSSPGPEVRKRKFVICHSWNPNASCSFGPVKWLEILSPVVLVHGSTSNIPCKPMPMRAHKFVCCYFSFEPLPSPLRSSAGGVKIVSVLAINKVCRNLFSNDDTRSRDERWERDCHNLTYTTNQVGTGDEMAGTKMQKEGLTSKRTTCEWFPKEHQRSNCNLKVWQKSSLVA